MMNKLLLIIALPYFCFQGLPDCEQKRTDSKVTCDEITHTLQGSSTSFQFLFTPATHHSHSSADDWHKKASKTPDALAEIMVSEAGPILISEDSSYMSLR